MLGADFAAPSGAGQAGGFASSTVLMQDGATGQMAAMDLGAPHIALAGLIVGLLGLKYMTESNLLSLNPTEIKVTIHNIIAVGLQSVMFLIFLKLGVAAMIKRGISIPGLADLAFAV
jgi:hypothetical protein